MKKIDISKGIHIVLFKDNNKIQEIHVPSNCIYMTTMEFGKKKIVIPTINLTDHYEVMK